MIQSPIIIKRSPIDGYGVFAAADIPKGIRFDDALTEEDMDIYIPKILFLAIKLLSPNLAALLEKYGYVCKFSGIHMISPDIRIWNMNHSEKPNIEPFYSPKGRYLYCLTTRKIKEGEEILIDYGTFAADKDVYFKK